MASSSTGCGASDYVGDTKTLDVHVKRLRAKIEPDPAAPSYLVTVRGLGYKFDDLSAAGSRRKSATFRWAPNRCAPSVEA